MKAERNNPKKAFLFPVKYFPIISIFEIYLIELRMRGVIKVSIIAAMKSSGIIQ
jgi:hypothetical protein